MSEVHTDCCPTSGQQRIDMQRRTGRVGGCGRGWLAAATRAERQVTHSEMRVRRSIDRRVMDGTIAITVVAAPSSCPLQAADCTGAEHAETELPPSPVRDTLVVAVAAVGCRDAQSRAEQSRSKRNNEA